MDDSPRSILLQAADKLLLEKDRTDVGVAVASAKFDPQTWRVHMFDLRGWNAHQFVSDTEIKQATYPSAFAYAVVSRTLKLLDQAGADVNGGS